MVPGEAFDMEILNPDQSTGAGHLRGPYVQDVVASTGYAVMEPRHLFSRFLPIAASLLFPTEGALSMSQLPQGGTQQFLVLKRASITHSC
jgi:hypothetical protein